MLRPDQYDAWLNTTPEEAEEFTAAPAPRASAAKRKAVPKKKDDSANGQLF
jgi:hypothetical protein